MFDYVETITLSGKPVRIMVNDISYWVEGQGSNTQRSFNSANDMRYCTVVLKSGGIEVVTGITVKEFDKLVTEKRVKVG